MKLKIKKKRIMAYLLVIVLTVSLISCGTITTHAAQLPVSNPVTSNKLIDMCLTRSGKVVNSDIREDVLTQTRNVLNDTATSYRQWCKDNGKAKSVETFREYLESDAYATLPFRLAKFPLELASFIEWLINGETLLDVLGDDVNDVLTEHDEKGNYTVPTETVNIINQCFENVKGNYNNGWRYVDVKASSDLPSAWFGDQGSWQHIKDYIDASENPTIIIYNKTWNNMSSYSYYYDVINNRETLYCVDYKSSISNGGRSFAFYNSNWVLQNQGFSFSNGAQQFPELTDDVLEEKIVTFEETSTRHWMGSNRAYWDDANSSNTKFARIYIFGKQSGTTIIYSSLQAIKDYSLGNTPYYLTNRQYSDSVDNSFNVSGEYIQNNGGTFAYEQIREQINNSNVTNDSSVSNIVNDYSQTIINNYNYSSGNNGSGENGGSGDNENGGTSILDGLGKIITAITDVIGFLLGVIGDVIGLIGELFNVVFNGLKALTGVFTGFTGVLGEVFTFIPTDLIAFMTLAIEASIGIAIWRKFSKK